MTSLTNEHNALSVWNSYDTNCLLIIYHKWLKLELDSLARCSPQTRFDACLAKLPTERLVPNTREPFTRDLQRKRNLPLELCRTTPRERRRYGRRKLEPPLKSRFQKRSTLCFEKNVGFEPLPSAQAHEVAFWNVHHSKFFLRRVASEFGHS